MEYAIRLKGLTKSFQKEKVFSIKYQLFVAFLPCNIEMLMLLL